MKLHTVEDVLGCSPVETLPTQTLGRYIQGQIPNQAHQATVQECLFAIDGEVFPQLGRLLIEVVVEAFEIPVAGDKAGGGLLPHSRHPRQVVGRVAPQRRVLGILAGRNPIALFDPGFVGDEQVRDPATDVENPAVIVDELKGVPVPAHDQHIPTVFLCLLGNGGNDVVGFETGHFDLLDPERVDDLPDER